MKKVLCIGSITTDVIVSTVEEIPPGGTLRAVQSIATHVGGCASNAAIDMAKLGASAALSCKVGKDSFGRLVLETAQQHGVDVRGVVESGDVETTVSIVCVNPSGERSFLYHPGSTSSFYKEDINRELAASCDIIFVAGAMLLTSFDGEPCAEFMREMQEQGKYTVLDTAWDFEDVWTPKVAPVLPYLDLFMPSYEEAVKLSGETEVERIAEHFQKKGAKNVVIKVGKDGAYVLEAGKEGIYLPAYQGIRAVDTTGAGDSFCAGFLTGLSQGWDFERCGRFANAVGAHCVMEIGASAGIKPMEEILKFMESRA